MHCDEYLTDNDRLLHCVHTKWADGTEIMRRRWCSAEDQGLRVIEQTEQERHGEYDPNESASQSFFVAGDELLEAVLLVAQQNIPFGIDLWERLEPLMPEIRRRGEEI